MDSISEQNFWNIEAFHFIIISLFLVIVAIGIIMLVLVYQKKHLQFVNEKNQLKTLFEKELLSSRLEIQEQTFMQISQEIHDNIGQMLTLVKLHLNTLELNSTKQSSTKLEDAKDVLSKAIQDLRDLSKTLNSDAVNQFGIFRAIESELTKIEKVTSIHTECKCDQNVLNINPQVELILFRIVQESLHNIIKHAKATSILVSTIQSGGQLLLTIKDDGVGFNFNDKSIRGNGLMNIQSRCKLINADLNIESVAGKGTGITLKVPVDNGS